MFSFVRVDAPDGARLGALTDGAVVDVTDVAPQGAEGIDRLFDDWANVVDAVAAEVDRRDRTELSALRLLPPLRPANLFLTFGNYGDHLKEMGVDPSIVRQGEPLIFQVPTGAASGPNDDIVIGGRAHHVDYEGELALVIGKAARHVAATDALSYVAGYAVLNDISVRDPSLLARGSAGATDYISLKGQATFKPFGPGVTPAAFVDDPGDLLLTTHVNGVSRQHSRTSDLVFSCQELISFMSGIVPLIPGDVISTGTPAGVGAPSGTFLAAGDLVEISIERLGTIRNRIVEK